MLNKEIADILIQDENFRLRHMFFLNQENFRLESGKRLFPDSGYYNYLNSSKIFGSVYLNTQLFVDLNGVKTYVFHLTTI